MDQTVTAIRTSAKAAAVKTRLSVVVVSGESSFAASCHTSFFPVKSVEFSAFTPVFSIFHNPVVFDGAEFVS